MEAMGGRNLKAQSKGSWPVHAQISVQLITGTSDQKQE